MRRWRRREAVVDVHKNYLRSTRRSLRALATQKLLRDIPSERRPVGRCCGRRSVVSKHGGRTIVPSVTTSADRRHRRLHRLTQERLSTCARWRSARVRNARTNFNSAELSIFKTNGWRSRKRQRPPSNAPVHCAARRHRARRHA